MVSSIGRHQGVERLLVVIEERPAHHLGVVGLGRVVVGVGHGEEPLGRGVVVVDELPGLLGQHPQQVALGILEAGPDAAVTVARETPPRHPERSMVAHSPCSWSRKTSSSARSRGPELTTARPLWWTSSMSLVALSRL